MRYGRVSDKNFITKRDTIFRELHESVAEVTIVNNEGERKVYHLTLKDSQLPKNYNKESEKRFHESHPDIIVAINAKTGGLQTVYINQIEFIEDVGLNYD